MIIVVIILIIIDSTISFSSMYLNTFKDMSQNDYLVPWFYQSRQISILTMLTIFEGITIVIKEYQIETHRTTITMNEKMHYTRDLS